MTGFYMKRNTGLKRVKEKNYMSSDCYLIIPKMRQHSKRYPFSNKSLKMKHRTNNGVLQNILLGRGNFCNVTDRDIFVIFL